MDGDAAFTLLTHPRNFNELARLGVGAFRFDGLTALYGTVISDIPRATIAAREQTARN